MAVSFACFFAGCASANSRARNPEVYDILIGQVFVFKDLGQMVHGGEFHFYENGQIANKSNPVQFGRLFREKTSVPKAWAFTSRGELELTLENGTKLVGKFGSGTEFSGQSAIRYSSSSTAALSDSCFVPRSLAITISGWIGDDGTLAMIPISFTKDKVALISACEAYRSESKKSRTGEISKKYGKRYAQLIIDGKTAVGMTKEMVIESLGETNTFIGDPDANGEYQAWVYEKLGKILYFQDNKLKSIAPLERY